MDEARTTPARVFFPIPSRSPIRSQAVPRSHVHRRTGDRTKQHDPAIEWGDVRSEQHQETAKKAVLRWLPWWLRPAASDGVAHPVAHRASCLLGTGTVDEAWTTPAGVFSRSRGTTGAVAWRPPAVRWLPRWLRPAASDGVAHPVAHRAFRLIGGPGPWTKRGQLRRVFFPDPGGRPARLLGGPPRCDGCRGGSARPRRTELPTLSPTAPLVCWGPAPWTKRGQLRQASFAWRAQRHSTVWSTARCSSSSTSLPGSVGAC